MALHGKNVSETRAIITLTAIFVTAIGSLVAVIGYLSINWPAYFFPALIFLVAINLAFEYRGKRRILRILNTNGYVQITESQPETYTGIYRPHWEIGHIQIPLAKRSVIGFPQFESWCPRFAPDLSEVEAEDDDLFKGGRQFIITFIGTPSRLGQYGHMGMMDRKVAIDSVVEITPLKEAV